MIWSELIIKRRSTETKGIESFLAYRDPLLLAYETIHMYKYKYLISIPAPSKGCQLIPKGWLINLIDTL